MTAWFRIIKSNNNSKLHIGTKTTASIYGSEAPTGRIFFLIIINQVTTENAILDDANDLIKNVHSFFKKTIFDADPNPIVNLQYNKLQVIFF